MEHAYDLSEIIVHIIATKNYHNSFMQLEFMVQPQPTVAQSFMAQCKIHS